MREDAAIPMASGKVTSRTATIPRIPRKTTTALLRKVMAVRKLLSPSALDITWWSTRSTAAATT